MLALWAGPRGIVGGWGGAHIAKNWHLCLLVIIIMGGIVFSVVETELWRQELKLWGEAGVCVFDAFQQKDCWSHSNLLRCFIISWTQGSVFWVSKVSPIQTLSRHASSSASVRWMHHTPSDSQPVWERGPRPPTHGDQLAFLGMGEGGSRKGRTFADS